MKSATFFALSAALFGFANAAPFDKRALVVNTVIEEVVQTVYETKTVWVDPSEATPTPNNGGQFFESSEAPAPTSSPAQSSAAPTSSTPTPTPAPVTPEAPVTPQAVESSAPAPAAPVPEPSSAPAPAPEPQPSPEPAPQPSPEPAPQPSPEPAPAPAPAPEPETPAPAPQPSTPAPEASTPAPPSNSGGSGSNAGDLTYYQPGMGACGVTNTESDWIVAVSHLMFDPKTPNGNPNNNPLCNKPIKIYYNGKSFDATITDRCAGCAKEGDLDMPQGMFNAVTGNTGDGRVTSGMTWSFA